MSNFLSLTDPEHEVDSEWGCLKLITCMGKISPNYEDITHRMAWSVFSELSDGEGEDRDGHDGAISGDLPETFRND